MGRQFTRRQLYELIWTDPVRTVAARLSLSGVGLAKTCHLNQIPIPPRGYWTRLRAGRHADRAPLPPRPLGKRNDIQLSRLTRTEWRTMVAALEKSALSPPIFDDSVPEMTERARQLVGVVTCSKHMGRCRPAITKVLEEDVYRRLRSSNSSHSALAASTTQHSFPASAVAHSKGAVLGARAVRRGSLPGSARRLDRTRAGWRYGGEVSPRKPGRGGWA